MTLRISETSPVAGALVVGTVFGLGITPSQMAPESPGFLNVFTGYPSLPEDSLTEFSIEQVSSTLPISIQENGLFSVPSEASTADSVSYYLKINGVVQPQLRTLNFIELDRVIGETLRIDAEPLLSGKLVVGDTGLGVLGATSPAGSIFLPYVPAGDLDKEIRIVPITSPIPFRIEEDGTFNQNSVPLDFTSLVFDLYVAGQLLGRFTKTFEILPGLSEASFSNTTSATSTMIARNLSTAVRFDVTTGNPVSTLRASSVFAVASFNVTTSVSSNMEARSADQAPSVPITSGVAIHLGGGLCITTEGRLFTVIM